MCGIAGIWNLGNLPVDPETLKRFTDSLQHRGPDGNGFYIDADNTIGLGHRRLAILDLSPSGRQPMSYAAERYWITFNGEIYNFLELRHELEAAGYTFQTQSDTEIILAAFDRWGPDCQQKFNGMWAFAIWDRREKTLFISRDRFAIKPLYYLSTSYQFAFASELKAFLHLDHFTAEPNDHNLTTVLYNAFSLEGTEETLVTGVKRLPGGHCLLVKPDEIKVWRWWNTLEHLVSPPKTLQGQAEHFQELFFDACRLRLRSDVPVATCLSGGLDSSAVLCTLSAIDKSSTGRDRMTENWRRAFVATFPETLLDEYEYAKVAIQHAGAIPNYCAMSSGDALQDLEQIIYDFDDVYIGLPVTGWAIYRELRRNGITVSLDGHGADEMLGGYPRYANAWLNSPLRIIGSPRRAWDLSVTLHNMQSEGYARSSSPHKILWNSFRSAFQQTYRNLCRALFLSVYNSPIQAAYRYTLRPFMKRVQGMLANTPAPAEASPWLMNTQERLFASREHYEENAIDELGAISAVLYRDFHFTVLPTILRNFDRCSMSHGVEVRMPFMDWRLVCFVFSLRDESKIGQGYTKLVLREAMKGIIPEPLRTRTSKVGFNSPMPEWFNGPMKEWIRDLVSSPDFLESDVWNGRAIQSFAENRNASGSWTWAECERLWPFLHAQAWKRAFFKVKH